MDGGWGRWSDWTDCSVTCGVGFRSRERKCNSPVPQNGGKPCNDSGRLETIDCIKPSCKGLWKWKCLRPFLKTKVLKIILVWYNMLVTLSFYKRRAENLGIALLTQSFHDPHIEFIYHVLQFIYLVDGGWGRWSDWTDCNRTCGIGMKSRTRKCDSPKPQNGGRACDKNEGVDIKLCRKRKCPENGKCLQH